MLGEFGRSAFEIGEILEMFVDARKAHSRHGVTIFQRIQDKFPNLLGGHRYAAEADRFLHADYDFHNFVDGHRASFDGQFNASYNLGCKKWHPIPVAFQHQ